MNINSNATTNMALFGTETPVAFVTGSGVRRVGRTIAERFRDSGFQVILHTHRSIAQAHDCVEQWRQDGHNPGLLVGDIANELEIQQWARTVKADYGRLDVLVHSAAIWEPTPLEQVHQSEYEAFFRTNVLGTALLLQHFGLMMADQKSGGALIAIGDWSVIRPYRDFTPYFASKSSVIGLTHAMAIELATRNPKVRVNAILPGPVLLADEITPDRRQKIIDECLLRREGTPEDVAHAAWFLATSPFVTGVCLPVDGGRSIYAGPSTDPIAHPRHGLD